MIRLAPPGPPRPCGGVLWGSPHGQTGVAVARACRPHARGGCHECRKEHAFKRYVEGLTGLRHGLLLIDGKADPELAAFIAGLDDAAYIWFPGEAQRPLNLLGGTPSQFAAKLVDVHHWTEPHYRAINHRYALQLGTFFSLSGKPRTPANVLRLLAPEDLDAEADALASHFRRSEESRPRGKVHWGLPDTLRSCLKYPARRLVISGLADRFAGISRR